MKTNCPSCKEYKTISISKETVACVGNIDNLMCDDCTNEKLANDFDYNYPHYEENVV